MNPSAELGRIAEELSLLSSECMTLLPAIRENLERQAASLRAVAAGSESATAGDALGMLEGLVEDGVVRIYPSGWAESPGFLVCGNKGNGEGPTLLAALLAAAAGGEG